MEKINHPKHYNQNPSGIECIDVAKHFNFCLGNAIKYIWRAGLKLDTDSYHSMESICNAKIEDLEKAIWYLQCEIETVKKDSKKAIFNKKNFSDIVSKIGNSNLESFYDNNASTTSITSDNNDV